jgi:hypothetical protein
MKHSTLKFPTNLTGLSWGLSEMPVYSVTESGEHSFHKFAEWKELDFFPSRVCVCVLITKQKMELRTDHDH